VFLSNVFKNVKKVSFIFKFLIFLKKSFNISDEFFPSACCSSVSNSPLQIVTPSLRLVSDRSLLREAFTAPETLWLIVAPIPDPPPPGSPSKPPKGGVAALIIMRWALFLFGFLAFFAAFFFLSASALRFPEISGQNFSSYVL